MQIDVGRANAFRPAHRVFVPLSSPRRHCALQQKRIGGVGRQQGFCWRPRERQSHGRRQAGRSSRAEREEQRAGRAIPLSIGEVRDGAARRVQAH